MKKDSAFMSASSRDIGDNEESSAGLSSYRSDGILCTAVVFLFLVIVAVIFGTSIHAHAANILNDSDMEAAGTASWSHVNITNSNSSAKSSDQSASGQSLKGISAIEKKINVGWYNEQTSIGTINSSDTVTLSLWHGAQWFTDVSGGANGTLYVDIQPAGGGWGSPTTIWSYAYDGVNDTPSLTFQSGTVTNLDVSAFFTVTQDYDIRVRFEGQTGNDIGASINVWWDDVFLDVTAAVCNRVDPTVTITTTNQDITADGGSVNYSVDITNNDNGGGCGNSTFSFTATDTNATDFDPSTPPTNAVLAEGATTTVTLTVNAKAGGTNLSTNNTYVTATNADHGNVNSNTRTTTINLICNRVDPTVTITTANQDITTDGGSVNYSVDITNNDNGGGCGSSTFSFTATDTNSTDFDPSTAPTNAVLAEGATTTVTLTVNAKAGGTNLSTNNAYVTATNADHGNVNSNTRTTTINLTCNRVDPTVTITTANQDITTDGGSVNYSVDITNNDNGGGCGSSTFSFTATDTNSTDFDPSTAPTNAVLAEGATTTVTLTVNAKAGGTNLSTNNTYVTATNADHGNVNSNTRTTTINVSVCNRVDPTVTITTANQDITTDGGSVNYSVDITNNDNGGGCGSSTFSFTATDTNSTDFDPSTAPTNAVLAEGATTTVTLTVNAKAGGTNLSTNNTYVTATNADHGNVNSNTRTTTINIPCIRTDPTVTLGTDQNIDTGDSTVYTVNITNNDTVVCTATTFSVSILSEIESNAGSFTLPSTLSSGPPCIVNNLSPGNSDTTCTVTVTGSGSGNLGDTLDTTVRTGSGNHNNVDTTVTTTIGNPLIHNSINLTSTKWAGDGGWGIMGGKYGEFTCETCHTKNTTNIKRIKETITAPNSPTDDFPGSSVIFTDPRSGSSDFGDDAGAHLTSQKICEVCHTYDATQANGVKFHAYDMSAGGADLTHNNQTDCTTCHKHSAGFKAADCASCHGNPPVDASAGGPNGLANNPGTTGSLTAGAHNTHVNTLGLSCTACHYNYSMPDPPNQDIDVGFSMFGLDGTGTSYNGQLVVNSYTGHNNTIVSSTGSAGGNDLTCSGIYCHGSTLTAGTNTTPYWDGTGTVTCGTCHGENAANPPTAGSHPQHAGNGSGELSLPCSDCHGGSAGAQGHVDGDVSWTLNTGDNRFGAGATYGGAASGSSGSTAPSASYGSCSSVYCHSTVQADGGSGAPTYNTPQWGNGPLTCATNCHTGNPGTGAHDTHLTQTDRSGVQCGTCHTGAGDGTASPASNHANYSIDVAEGTYTSGGTPRNGYGSCSTSACHNDGTGTTVSTPTWDQTIACDSCHSTIMATLSHNEHLGSTERTIGCGDCHAGAVQGLTKPTNNHNDGKNNADNTYTQNAQTYDAVYGTCSTAACHNDGTGTSVVTPVWGQPIACDSCHAINMTTNAHDVHLGSTERTIGCGDCHTGAVQGTTKPTSNHNDGLNNADLNGYTDNGGAYGNGYGYCSTAACHNDGTGTAVNTPNWNQAITCNSCHATNMATLSHDEHLGSTERTIGCGDCHAGAVQGTTKPTNNHNDGQNNADNTYTQNAQTYDAVYGTCLTAACHNDGAGTPVVTPVWGQAIACNGCHDTTAATLNTGSHSEHMNTAIQTIGCGDCHTGAVAGTTKPTSNHNNGLNNVDAGSYDGGGAYGNGYGSCSTAACHGTATWGGGALGCDTCHLGTGDTDNFAWDGTKAVIDTTDWNSAGHGGYGTANLACTDCHSSGVNHNTAANYFRLSNQTNTLCMGCHNTAQGSTPAVDGLEHYGGKHSATENGGNLCWDCHDPHGDGPIRMIHDKPWMRRDANGIPTRIADDTTVLFTTTGTESSYVTADLRGVCQVCHDQATTITKYFRYNSYPTVAGGGASGGYDTGHSGGSPCTDCHAHSAWQGSGDCTACHNGVPGTTYVTRDVVGSDYTQSSRHVFGGTVTNWDCIVCHREGDANDAVSGTVTRSGLHENYQVDMRNVDSINTGWVWDKYDGTCSNVAYDNINECVDNGAAWTWNNSPDDQMHTDMDSFCMSCHDSDSSRGAGLGGASGIAVKSDDSGVTLSPTVAERTKPFNSSDGVDAGTGGGTANVAGYERTAVLDVYKQFDPANPSHHAVRGTAYSSHNANWGDTAWVDRTLKSGDRLITDAVYEAAKMHCADCHTVDQNAHGGANGFMLQASSIDDTCFLCHNSGAYNDASSADTRWDHSNESSAFNTAKGSKLGQYGLNNGSICLNCHGGDPVSDGFGGIHGLPYNADNCLNDPGYPNPSNPDCDWRSGEPRYRFQGGSYMSHTPSSWTGTSGVTATCYYDPTTDTQPWSNCTQHGGSGKETETGRTDVPQYSRGVPGDY